MLEQGDLVLCTVERVEKTIVFVKIEGEGDGSIVTSEIAPGRIRNLRDYVVPKKRIVCKILRISDRGNIELSLRRVSLKEKKEVMDKYSHERAYLSILKKILGDKTEEVVEKIKKENNVFDFFQEVKKNPEKLEKIIGKDASKILEILNVQKTKIAIVKKEINMKTDLPNGVKLIKNILGEANGAEIKYLAAGKYSIKTESDDIKKADNKLREIVAMLEKIAKENRVDFSIKEK